MNQVLIDLSGFSEGDAALRKEMQTGAVVRGQFRSALFQPTEPHLQGIFRGRRSALHLFQRRFLSRGAAFVCSFSTRQRQSAYCNHQTVTRATDTYRG